MKIGQYRQDNNDPLSEDINMREIPFKGLIALGILCLGLAVGSAWAQGVNVAQGKTATASSTWDASTTAVKVVDGVAPAGYPEIFHSGSGDRAPWWQVDLGRVYLIQRIVIWNRQDCCQIRLRDITVQIQGPANEVLFETLVNPGDILAGPPTITVTPNISVPGRFVRISRTEDNINLSGDDQYLLQLAEVQVFDQTPLQAFGPAPADGALRVGVNAAALNQANVDLSWFSGVGPDPKDPNLVIIDPLLVTHKVYISNAGSTDPNDRFLGEVAAGSPPQATAQFGPIALTRDAAYLWRVDEIRSNGQTVKGRDWKFSTESAKPVILSVTPAVQSVWSVESAAIAGEKAESAQITVQAENPYSKDAAGMTFAWFFVKTGGDIKVAEGSPTLTIPTVKNDDAGLYYCVVTLAAPSTGTSTLSSNAQLKIKHILGHWPFDGDYTDTVSGNNGTALGGPLTFVPGIVPAAGGTGQAVKFIGQGSQAVTIPTSMVAGPVSWTFSFWEYTNSAIAAGYMLGSGEGSGAERLYVWRREGTDPANGNTDYYGNLNVAVAGSIGPINATFPRLQWHQVTWTFDAASMVYTWYVDGRARASAAVPQPWPGFDTLFYFGNRRNMQRPFTGFIDDFRVYDYPMSAREVAELYLETTGGYFCWTQITGDFNGDCMISIADLAAMAANWTNCNLIPASACK
jgi:hypothetical protein